MKIVSTAGNAWTLGSEPKTENELLAEATRWILHLREAPEGSPVCLEFNTWLATSPDHRSAWETANATWRFLGAAQPAYDQTAWCNDPPDFKTLIASGSSVAARRKSTPRSYRQPVAVAFSAIAAICLLWVAVPSVLLGLQADHRTGAGKTELVRMADGSTVELGGSTAIKSDIDATRRKVTLLAGEAFFDVALDASRPFIVDVQGVEIKVLGTAFDVQVSSTNTTVSLLRGSVEASSSSDPGRPTTLVPGKMLVVDHATGHISVKDVALEDIGSWRDGKILLTGATVSEAVEIIQRYHTAWLSIPDRGLVNRKVSGLFDLRDPDAALAAIVGSFGGRVRSVTPLVRIITRR